jgi:hypothetical protein
VVVQSTSAADSLRAELKEQQAEFEAERDRWGKKQLKIRKRLEAEAEQWKLKYEKLQSV